MQASKEIVINGKPALIGCTKGVLGVKGGTYVLIQETGPDGVKYVQAYYIAKQEAIPEQKYIAMFWAKIKIAAPTLKPMEEYYDHNTGKCLFVEDRNEDGIPSISDKKSFQQVIIPGVGTFEIPSYDAFFEMQGNDKAGKVLFGIALDRFCERELKIGNVLKMNATNYELIQPVKAELEFLTRVIETDPYRLNVLPVHGVAPFQFSVNGTDYAPEPELTYSDPAGKKVFVKDAAGTVAEYSIKPADWLPLVL